MHPPLTIPPIVLLAVIRLAVLHAPHKRGAVVGEARSTMTKPRTGHGASMEERLNGLLRSASESGILRDP